jgi:anti-sigma factor RsiW
LRDELQEIRTAMNQHARYERPAPEFRSRIEAAIAREAGTSRPTPAPFWRGALSGAVATALAASIALFVLLPRPADRMADDVVAAHLRSLVGNHLIDVASSNHHVVKPWFAGRADISPPVADFAGQGFALAGGRIDFVDGRRAAVVVYRHGGHVVNVFAWKDDGSVPPGAHSLNGFHLLSWKEGGLMLCAVSDTAPQELRALADLIRKNS